MNSLISIIMCQELQIKIAIIRRVGEQIGCGYTHATLASQALGCDVTQGVVAYVCGNTNDKIVADIYNGVPIAIELDNLVAGWDLKIITQEVTNCDN